MVDGANPTIDTNLGPAPMGAAGAVGLMSDLAEMRNRQNTNVLFQQQMSARHQLGEDLAVWSAQGLSPEEQTKRAQQQPYSVFVTPEISNISGVQKNQVEIAEARERMINNGLGPLAQALNASGGDPKLLDTLLGSVMKSYPPDVQKSLQPAYDGMKASLNDGLPTDPDAAKAAQKARAARIGAAFGVPLDTAYSNVDTVKPQTVVMPGGGVSLIGGVPGQTSPPLVPVGSPLTTAPPATKALDGSPLFAPDSALPPQFKTNLTGTKAFQSTQAEAVANEAAKQWQTDQPRYEQVAQSNATIGNMLDEFRTTSKGGGVLTPGFAGESRAMLANAVNTFYAVFNPGAPPPVDPVKMAASDAESKNAHQLAFQVVSLATGQSREALGTLQMGYNSVPNMDKTPLGNVVVGEVMQATGNWLLQKQQFERDWMSRTGGDLTNAAAEYLKEHPPEKVMDAVLGTHGIGPNGYTSHAAFLRDFHDGLLTSGKEAPLETAATIAHDKGWITDNQFKALKSGGFKPSGEGSIVK
jgi:hypothetical protein